LLIHHRGDAGDVEKALNEALFNLRPAYGRQPRGGRPHLLGRLFGFLCFNPRTRARATGVVHTPPVHEKFQYTPPHGGRQLGV
jgi:hypothetical protein